MLYGQSRDTLRRVEKNDSTLKELFLTDRDEWEGAFNSSRGSDFSRLGAWQLSDIIYI